MPNNNGSVSLSITMRWVENRLRLSNYQIVDHRADVAEEYNEAFVETGELESLW